MKNRLIQSILLASVMALLIVCVFIVFLLQETQASRQANQTATTKAEATTSPTATLPYINITREQYEAALYRWNLHGIQEYTMRVSRFCNCYPFFPYTSETYRVTNGKAVVVSYSCSGICMTAAPSTATPRDREGWSVEEMFAYVEELLNDEYQVYSNKGVRYVVTFHPTYGYPAYIASEPVSIDHGWGHTNVEGITVLKKSNTPIIPSTTAKPSP